MDKKPPDIPEPPEKSEDEKEKGAKKEKPKQEQKKRHHNRHHPFPTSRYSRLAYAEWNIRTARAKRHALFHMLVGNDTTCEALIRLLLEFGPGDITHLTTDPGFTELLELLTYAKGK